MSKDPQFDFWYAVNHTEVVTAPQNRLETFGTTMVNYYLVTELMDSVDKVRVREGKLKAYRPEIITPPTITDEMLDGFGDEAQDYAKWLQQHAQDMQMLKYGFKVQKEEINDYILSDSLEAVVDRVKEDLAERNDPLGALLVGVDRPWEVCLLKLMMELVQGSAQSNIQDIRQLQRDQKMELYQSIEKAFLAASRNSAKVPELAELLRENGLFERYEDRFFAAVRASQK
jgi:hypothetical protein